MLFLSTFYTVLTVVEEFGFEITGALVEISRKVVVHTWGYLLLVFYTDDTVLLGCSQLLRSSGEAR